MTPVLRCTQHLAQFTTLSGERKREIALRRSWFSAGLTVRSTVPTTDALLECPHHARSKREKSNESLWVDGVEG